MKKVALELGGKSPFIILDDAPLDEAVNAGFQSAYLNGGQTCIAWTRMLVPESRKDEFVAKAKEVAETFTTGDPMDPATRLGPMISETQRDRVRSYINKGIEEGATLVTGGAEAPEGLDKGYFIRPTVFADVTNDMTIAREEIFGPVLSIITYSDEDDAVRIANDTVYGLHAGVYGGDKEHAAAGRSAHPGGSGRRERHAVQPDRAVRWVQAVRPRPGVRSVRPRGVPRGEVDDRRVGQARNLRSGDPGPDRLVGPRVASACQARRMGAVVLRADGVTIVRDGRALLSDVDWTVAAGERWVVIGPNGSGKTTLLQIAGARLHPSRGTIEILGQRLGSSDWRAVRAQVGFVSGSVVRSLRPSLDALDIVVTGKHGALEPWWHTYTDEDRARGLELMELTGVAALADRPFGVISEGERQQVLLARMLMGEPGLAAARRAVRGSGPRGARTAARSAVRAGIRPGDSADGPRHPSRRGDPARDHARARPRGRPGGRVRSDRRRAHGGLARAPRSTSRSSSVATAPAGGPACPST